jgi:hypothetical protein
MDTFREFGLLSVAVFKLHFREMGRGDKKSNKKAPAKKSESNKKYPLVTQDGRHITKARARITSTQKGVDALNTAELEKLLRRITFMAMCRVAAAKRIQLTSRDTAQSARDIKGMPELYLNAPERAKRSPVTATAEEGK